MNNRVRTAWLFLAPMLLLMGSMLWYSGPLKAPSWPLRSLGAPCRNATRRCSSVFAVLNWLRACSASWLSRGVSLVAI